MLCGHENKSGLGCTQVPKGHTTLGDGQLVTGGSVNRMGIG